MPCSRFELRFEPVPVRTGSQHVPARHPAATAKAARDVLAGRLLPVDSRRSSRRSSLTYNTFSASNGLVGNTPALPPGSWRAACILQMRANRRQLPRLVSAVQRRHPAGSLGVPPPHHQCRSPRRGSRRGVVPFALHDSTQLRPAPGPPALTSGLYTRDYNEVKELGAKLSACAHPRPDRAGQLLFRQLPGADAARSPQRSPKPWARISVRAHVSLRWGGNRRSRRAHRRVGTRSCTDRLWRPITAIREGDFDGNARTDGSEPLWEPFIATPPYPDSSSGQANNLTSSIMRTVELFFQHRQDHVRHGEQGGNGDAEEFQARINRLSEDHAGRDRCPRLSRDPLPGSRTKWRTGRGAARPTGRSRIRCDRWAETSPILAGSKGTRPTTQSPGSKRWPTSRMVCT